MTTCSEAVVLDLLYQSETIDELKAILRSARNLNALRAVLYSEFLSLSCYSTPEEWNRAVRMCECFAIIGWGENIGVEAQAGKYFNGNPATCFISPAGKTMYLDAVWHTKDGGLAIEPSLSTLNGASGEISVKVSPPVPLFSQRNWLPKAPVKVYTTLANCYPGSRPVLDSFNSSLNPLLRDCMRPELYGSALNRIYINCAMSFNDGPHCLTNYIVADPAKKLRKGHEYSELLKIFPAGQIEREGLYLRPRFDIGPFRKNTGCVNVTVVFEKDFSSLDVVEQKQVMSDFFLQAATRIADRLSSKIDYDFPLMLSDFRSVLFLWVQNSSL